MDSPPGGARGLVHGQLSNISGQPKGRRLLTADPSRSIPDLVDAGEWTSLRDRLRQRPGKVRSLLSMLHEVDSDRLAAVFVAFERAVPDAFDEERLRDLARKLMWLLNEESGNHCPAAALALAALGRARPDIVEAHRPVLGVYATDPSPGMAEACRVALARMDGADTPWSPGQTGAGS